MPKNKDAVIAQLLEIAQTHDDSGNNDKGNDIRALIAEVNDNKRDHTQIKIKARIQIDKYDGDIVEGDMPVETSEFISEI